MAQTKISNSAAESHQHADVVGRCWTQVLISSGERDLSDTVVLGTKLMAELQKRGLVILPEVRK